MARGRMLNKTVCASKQFDDLPDDTCRLLATWIISNLDCHGVFYGDAAMVKSYVFPRRADVTVDQVTGYLETMSNVGLIVLFDAKGDAWQYWPGFTGNQIGLRADKERTTFPPPPDFIPQDDGTKTEDVRQDDGKESAQEKRSEVNRSQREVNTIEIERSPVDNSPSDSTLDFSTTQASSDSDKSNALEAEGDVELLHSTALEVVIRGTSAALGDNGAVESNITRAYNIWCATGLGEDAILSCMNHATRQLEKRPRDPPLKKPAAWWFKTFENEARRRERERVRNDAR